MHPIPVIIILSLFINSLANAQKLNGFDLSNSSIPREEIFKGGPPKNGIPSINRPRFISVNKVDYLKNKDIIIGFEVNGEVRAYPTRILIWHEIVNDVIQGQSIAVTYCPLCGTSMVFDRNVGGKNRSFGVSGLLYQSDVLMYDRQSESLWSQIAMKAVSGPAKGTKLQLLHSKHMTWEAFKIKHPNGKVLYPPRGNPRDYRDNPYIAYFASPDLMFPVPKYRKELRQKSWVLGVIINGQAKAYPIRRLSRAGEVKDLVDGKDIYIQYDSKSHYPQITDSAGKNIPFVISYWFAWQAFYPKTEIWSKN